jgi:hypothetical protein
MKALTDGKPGMESPWWLSMAFWMSLSVTPEVTL